MPAPDPPDSLCVLCALCGSTRERNRTNQGTCVNPTIGRLLPGPAHFTVEELPLYAPAGDGEHLYVEIEKEGLTTDVVIDALAKALGKRSMDVGCAGRKDRHAVTRQWFSVHFGDEALLANLGSHLRNGRASVLRTARHRNKLRTGHLAGNRFRLGLGDVHDLPALERALAALAAGGLRHRFGPQRFGFNGSTLAIAKAWGAGDVDGAIARIVDPAGGWQVGQPIPDGFRPGPEGRVVGALRKGVPPAKALRAADDLRKLVASAAQAAVFNAVLAARERLGLLDRVREGDLAQTAHGAPFLVGAGEADAVSERCRRFDAAATGPMPGTWRLAPSPAVAAEERAWSEDTGIAWEWFAERAPFDSPGGRRPLLVPLLEPPRIDVADTITWVSFALPAGAFATEALMQCGVAIPDDRRG